MKVEPLKFEMQLAEKKSSDQPLGIEPKLQHIADLNKLVRDFDFAKGWPPRLIGETKGTIKEQPLDYFIPSKRMFKVVTKSAMRNKKLRKTLGEKFIHALTQHYMQRDFKYPGSRGDAPYFEFRLLFFSYTHNHTFEVLVGGGKEFEINHLPDIHLPETREEIIKAIQISCKDPKIATHVHGMSADAMLEPITDTSHPSHDNRVMRVMFSDKYDPHKESPVRYCALVDLNSGTVLMADEAPCI